MEAQTKNEKTYERHDVEETPFSIIKECESGICQIAIGTYYISRKTFSNIEDAKKYVKKRPWELIFNTTALICDNIINNQPKQQSND